MGTAATVLGAASALLLLSGVVLAVAGTRVRARARRFEQRAVSVPGRVVDLRLRRGVGEPGEGGSLLWFPVLDFSTIDGRTVRTEAMYGSVPAPARPGHQVRVLYDPQRPTRARIGDRTLASGGCLATAMTVAGALTAVLGLLMGAIAVALVASIR
jgi:Protein of unknown function (DUF3592)